MLLIRRDEGAHVTQLLRFELLTIYGKLFAYPPSGIHVHLPTPNAPAAHHAAINDRRSTLVYHV